METNEVLKQIVLRREAIEKIAVRMYEAQKPYADGVPDNVLKALCRLEAKRMVEEDDAIN